MEMVPFKKQNVIIKNKYFNEQFEGFTLKVDLNSTKRERIILSLKKAMETLKKNKKIIFIVNIRLLNFLDEELR